MNENEKKKGNNNKGQKESGGNRPDWKRSNIFLTGVHKTKSKTKDRNNTSIIQENFPKTINDLILHKPEKD